MNTKEHHFVAYLHTPEETIRQYNATLEGLGDTERTHRQTVYGKNILAHGETTPGWIKLLAQFKDTMIILLLVSAGIAFALQDIRTATVLLAIVLINAWIGYRQEAKAERLLETLKHMVQSNAKIRVDSQVQEILAENLVPGDILVIQEGDTIPADMRIIEEHNLQTNDFSLTGESNPKRKHAHRIVNETELGDRTNMCFMGTTVATGNAVGVVVATGGGTELGKIATLSTETSTELSPLQKEMNHTVKGLTITTVVIGVSLFVIALLLDWEIQTALLFSIGIAASMVPQGLPAQISIALASSAGFLAKKKALVKKLSAVETLGAVNVICTDKTGTLTTNQMTVQSLRYNNSEYTVTGTGYEPTGDILQEDGTKITPSPYFELFMSVGVLASTAHIRPADDEHPSRWVIGDPTEGALMTVAGKVGITEDEYTKTYPLIHEASFDSDRKRMSMVRQLDDGTYRVYVKGSLQTLLPCCTHMLNNDAIEDMDEATRRTVTDWDNTQASNAMRNLSYAYKDIADWSEDMTTQQIESDLTFLGMVSMIDPPRANVPAAIAAAKAAHIKIIIITGDYSLTARAIAKKIGLVDDDESLLVFSGKEMRAMSDIALSTNLEAASALIFSRVSPTDKVRVVTECKKLGRIVAVTGDGVNDAPALKKADIGVAMGKTGTDVAKEAAEIILLDDSFATLVEAIRQGRIIYQNIAKNVLSCITTNWSELFAVLLGLAGTMMGGLQMAITAVQILAIDLLGEMGPLAALSQDPASEGLMQKPARDTNHHMIHKNSMKDMVLSGFIMGACSYGGFLLITGGGQATGTLLAQGQATTYLVIVLSQYVNILSRRTKHNTFFTSYLWSNKRLLQAMGLSLGIIICIFYIPFMSQRFSFAAPSWKSRLIALGGAGIYGVRRYRVQGKGRKYFTRSVDGVG